MPEQRPYTVAAGNSLKFAIVWTRGKDLARDWAYREWQLDKVFIDVWPTTSEDQDYLKELGQKEVHI